MDKKVPNLWPCPGLTPPPAPPSASFPSRCWSSCRDLEAPALAPPGSNSRPQEALRLAETLRVAEQRPPPRGLPLSAWVGSRRPPLLACRAHQRLLPRAAPRWPQGHLRGNLRDAAVQVLRGPRERGWGPPASPTVRQRPPPRCQFPESPFHFSSSGLRLFLPVFPGGSGDSGSCERAPHRLRPRTPGAVTWGSSPHGGSSCTGAFFSSLLW